MTGCMSLQQRVKIKWLSKIAIWRHCTEPSLFERICSLSDFQNKHPSNCTDLRREDFFCPQLHKLTEGGLNLNFARALPQLAVPSIAGCSEHHHRRERASPLPMSTGRWDSMPGIVSATVCTRISSWLRPAQLTTALPSSAKGLYHSLNQRKLVSRTLAFWRNDGFTGMCLSH